MLRKLTFPNLLQVQGEFPHPKFVLPFTAYNLSIIGRKHSFVGHPPHIQITIWGSHTPVHVNGGHSASGIIRAGGLARPLTLSSHAQVQGFLKNKKLPHSTVQGNGGGAILAESILPAWVHQGSWAKSLLDSSL